MPFASLLGEDESASNRVLDCVLVHAGEHFLIPPTVPLSSDSDQHELGVFWAFETGRQIKMPPIKMFCLQDVLVMPQGIAFFGSGECIIESLYPFNESDYSLRFPELVEYCNNPLLLSDLSTSCNIIEEAVFLREPGETGYFHWVNSVLPRIALLERFPRLKQLPLLMYPMAQFAASCLECFNLTMDNILLHSRPILVRRLWMTTPCVTEGDHFTRSPFWTRELRRVLGVDGSPQPTRIVFIGRSDAGVRQIVDERAVKEIFSQIGAETVSVEGMNFASQLSLFRDVKCLISPHGAGLSNSIFMPSGHVFELVSRRRLWPTYRSLAARAGLSYGAYISETERPSAGVDPGNENFCIDLQKLADFASCCGRVLA